MNAEPSFVKHFDYLKDKYGTYPNALREVLRVREGEDTVEAKAMPPGFLNEFERLGAEFSQVRLREGIEEAMAKDPHGTLAKVKEVKREYGIEVQDRCIFWGFLTVYVRNWGGRQCRLWRD